MTVSSIDSVAEFDTNGVTFNFPFYFKFLKNEDLVVTYVDPGGVSSTLTLGTQYTVSGAGNDAGGSVTTSVVLAGPGKLAVSREMEPYQLTSLRNQGKFLAETHEDVFDRLTMLIQQGFSIFKRALTRPYGKAYYDAENRLIKNLGDPVDAQDAMPKEFTERYLASLLATITGPINNSANVFYQYPDGSPHVVQDLAGLTGASGIRTSRGSTAEFELTDIASAIRKAGISDFFAQGGAANVLMLGDSLGAGAGQPGGYPGGYMGRVARSIMNAFDKYPGPDRGYLNFAWLNGLQQLQSEPGWSQTGGSAVSGGPAGSAWRLPLGAWIERTGLEISQGKVFYAPSTNGSTMRVTVNGVPAIDITVNASGMSTAFSLTAVPGTYIKPSDKVRLTCTYGSVDIYNFRLLRAAGSRGPLMYCSPEGSQSFSDYTEATRSALLASYTTADQAGVPTLICCFLGTNNMITAAGKQKTPAAMVADMQAFVTRWRTLIPDCAFLFWVPPRPRADILLPLGTYEEYSAAIVAFVSTLTRAELVRLDRTWINGPEFYSSDGFHLNDIGHASTAKEIGSGYFGAGMDTGNPGFFNPPSVFVSASVGWTLNNAATMAINPMIKEISGTMSKTGGGATVVIGQVDPLNPPLVDTYWVASDQAGVPRTIKLEAGTGVLSLVDAAALASVTAIRFSGQTYHT